MLLGLLLYSFLSLLFFCSSPQKVTITSVSVSSYHDYDLDHDNEIVDDKELKLGYHTSKTILSSLEHIHIMLI